MKKILGSFLILCFALSCISETKQSAPKEVNDNTLLGSWDMKRIEWITADTVYTIEKAQPGIFMVTPTRYSIIWTPTQEPRKAFEKLSAPTDEEIIAGFRSVVFNAGTYVRTDSTLTTEAHIAKVPGFEGGIQYYDYQLSADTLSLTMFDETYPDGSKPDWAGTWKTRFIMKRISTEKTP